MAGKKKTSKTPSRGRSRKNHSLAVFLHLHSKALWLGLGGVGVLYILLLYFFLIDPSSFRWKAIFSEPKHLVGYSIYGIDVSHHQGTIDWERLRNANIDRQPITFVFVKATEGGTLIDENFNDNFYKARRNDLIRGAYHYFIPSVPARKQAQHFLRQVHLEPGDMPPVLDIEETGNLTTARLTESVLTWLQTVEKATGVKPILYTSYRFKLDYLYDKRLAQYPYWIAHYYVDKVRYKGHWAFWQYADNGRVDGIKGKVDLNTFHGTGEDLANLLIPEEDDNDNSLQATTY